MDQALVEWEKVLEQNKVDVNPWIHFLFDAWYIIMRPDYDHLPINKEDLQLKLTKYFKEAYNLFFNNARFLFYIGFPATISFWYFIDENDGDKGDKFAFGMLRRAFLLEPDNVIYEWGNTSADIYFNKDERNSLREKYKMLTKEVKGSNKWIDEGFIGDYFRETVRESKHEGSWE